MHTASYTAWVFRSTSSSANLSDGAKDPTARAVPEQTQASAKNVPLRTSRRRVHDPILRPVLQKLKC